MWHVWKRGVVRTGFGGGNLRQRDNLKGLDVDGWIILIGASNNTLAWA